MAGFNLSPDLLQALTDKLAGLANGHQVADFPTPIDGLWLILENSPGTEAPVFAGWCGTDPDRIALAGEIFKLTPGAAPAPAHPFTVHRSSEIFLPQNPPEWIIPDLLLKQGISIWYGDAGLGKTYVILNLAYCLAAGQPWLGFNTNAGPVLIIDEESGQERLRRRLREVADGLGLPAKPLSWITMENLSLHEATGIQNLQGLIATEKPSLVVSDAMVDLWLGAKEEASNEIQPILHAIRTICNQHNLHWLGIHHENRTSGYRGSSVIKGAVDLLIRMSKGATPDEIVFITEKARDIAPVTFAAKETFDKLNGLFTLTATTAPTGPATGRPAFEQAILNHLVTFGATSVADLIQHLPKYKQATILKGCGSLKRDGLITDLGGVGMATIYASA